MFASCKNSSTPLGVGAFRQPDAARVAPEAAAVMVARREDLRADGRRMAGHQRQQTVRGGGGDDFQQAFVLKFFEGGDEVAVVMPPRSRARQNLW
jgi:hypothetical protein